MSAQVTSDCKFCSILSSTWGIQENDTTSINKEYVRGLVERLREKLYNKTVGVKEEYVLKKIFKDFDIQRTHDHPRCFDIEQLEEMLVKCSIPLCRKYLKAFFNFFDQKNLGYIEYEFFEQFIIFDPYK